MPYDDLDPVNAKAAAATPPPPGHLLVRWIFLRALGAIYAIAFASLLAQADGLIGSQGIVPAAEQMDGWRDFADGRGIGVIELAENAERGPGSY